MQATTVQPTAAWLSRVAALLHSGATGPSAVAQFLPSKDDPDYSKALSQLVLADLRAVPGSERSSAWAIHRSHFPELPASEHEINLDNDVESQIDLTQTPMPVSHLQTNATRVRPLDVIELNPVTPRAVPKCGEKFGGFTLIDELGRGAFGRAYLATEQNLADRLVALKITKKANRESQKLARLQHTNIVPIHNAFEQGGWHVVQMPFFGRQTLADLVDTVRAEKTFPKVRGDVFASTQMRMTTSRKPSNSTQSSPSTNDSHEHRVSPEVLAGDGERQPSRELLVGLSYIDAAIWLVARLADGLSHAHAKGILHLDLKPHNVLLSDDGQPMLLDFNLSFDVNKCERDRVGGTWPYMSPEQICEYARRPGAHVDPRSDLFSLGVMFFELLTLQQPFPPVTSTPEGLNAAIAARTAGAPDVREFNPNVPASIAAVVAKLLEASPMQRYQTADELRDDLRHHVENRPLKFARDRSVRERVIKWHRRNPRLSLAACVAVLALGLAFSAAQMMAWSKDRETVAAKEKAAKFRTDAVGMRLDLATILETNRRDKALEKAKQWLKDYNVGEKADWASAPAIRLLPEADQVQLKAALAEMAMLAAHAEWLDGRHRLNAEKAEHFGKAEAFNKTARTAYGDKAPVALATQQKELAGEASTVSKDATTDPADLYARAMRLIADGNYADAGSMLVQLTQLQPDHFAGQFALGLCYQYLGEPQRAAERFQVAKPLGPHDARPAYHRGMILAAIGRYEEAEADFTEAIQRDATQSGVRLQRACVRKIRGDSAGAIEDLTAELNAVDGHRIIALAVRATVYDKLGEADAAKKDRAAIDALEPTTDLDYVARGVRWMSSDPAKAIADYDRALKLNPDCYSALQNKAHVYADALKQPELALAACQKAAATWPGFNKVRIGHAVVLARLGKREKAHQEAEAALQLGSDAEVTYMAACTYALTAKADNEDADKAIALFRQCLREGYRKFEVIAIDPDMANVRDLADFQKALTAAQELVK